MEVPMDKAQMPTGLANWQVQGQKAMARVRIHPPLTSIPTSQITHTILKALKSPTKNETQI